MTIDTNTILSTLILWTIYSGLIWGVFYAIYKTIKNKLEYNHRHNGGVRSWRTRSRREIIRVHTAYRRPVAEVRSIPYSENGIIKNYITIAQ